MNRIFASNVRTTSVTTRRWLAGCVLAVLAAIAMPAARSDAAEVAASGARSAAATAPEPRLALGIGDAVTLQVYGRPELSTTTYVSDDGTIPVPLAGRVAVARLSPASAGQRVAAAFREGRYLVDPQVTLLITQFRSQQVSVLGAVRTPGRFVVESTTTVMDVLALAGGITDNGGRIAYLLRTDDHGAIERSAIDLDGLNRASIPLPTLNLHGGDAIFVPPAEQFYVYGEVQAPNMYRLEAGMTVVQALSRSGGITPRGSSRRIEIRRHQPDGSYVLRAADLADVVHADDVIRVKERIF